MIEKKVRTKIPKETKIRAELQKEINSCCPFCDSTDVGHFQIHHIDDNPSNNLIFNLLLLCPTCHSKITKGDIIPLDVVEKKIALLSMKPKAKIDSAKTVNFNSQVGNAVVGDNNKIVIKQTKKIIKTKYQGDCVGADNSKANYISYLINRYNDYKKYDVGKGNVNYSIFNSILKKRYKLGAQRTIYHLHLSNFENLVEFIKYRIDGTKLARAKGTNHKNYSSFEEHQKHPS